MNPAVFLILIVTVPILELFLLIKAGGEIGAARTIVLVLVTAAVGMLMVRAQGVSTGLRVHQAIQRDEVPAIPMLEGTLLLVGGMMLVLPGFITDILGLICLIPVARRFIVVTALKRAGLIDAEGKVRNDNGPDSRRVIEGEYRRHED